jgi:branched-subunit amino acid ABC-type transport system permease component
MTHEEKRAWIRLVITALSYAAYVAVVVSHADGRPLAGVPYAAPLLWSIGVSIIASIVVEIAISIANPKASRDKDVRDRQIGRFGEYVGQSPLIIGATAALGMALADWDRFLIANVIYLGFVLSAILGTATKLLLYRRTFSQW